MNTYSRMFFLCIIVILTLFMIINPYETVNAAGQGFELWYSVIVPALLPFFIAADLLISLGFAQFLGVILEPVMRPLFKLPGCSSLVVAIGFTSGFPIGAILTRRLYDDKMITGSDAERLVSFTNNSSPLFILGAVGVGMFNSPMLGCLLAASHYLANLLVGLIWGLTAPPRLPPKKTAPGRLLYEAFKTLAENKADEKTPGRLLSDSIKNAVNNILAIAGFIIIFSVLTRMLSVWGIMHFLAVFWSKILFFLNLPYQAAFGIGMGMFEITIGSKSITAAASHDILDQLLAVSMVLAFSGFSIIAQVMGIVAGMPVRLSFYLKSRLMQMLFSLIITWAGYRLFFENGTAFTLALPIEKALYSVNAWQISLWCMLISFIIILIMLIFSLIQTIK